MSGDILQFREFINTAPYAEFTDGIPVANDPYGTAVFVQENETGAGPDHINAVDNVVAISDGGGQGIVSTEAKFGAYSYVGPGDPLLDNGFNSNIADRWVGSKYDIGAMDDFTLHGWFFLPKAPTSGARAYMMMSNSYPVSGAGTSWGGYIDQSWSLALVRNGTDTWTIQFSVISSNGTNTRLGNNFGAAITIGQWQHLLIQAKRIVAPDSPAGFRRMQIWLDGVPINRSTGSGFGGTAVCKNMPSDVTSPSWTGGLTDLLLGMGGVNGWGANNAYTWPGYLDGWRVENGAPFDLACDAVFDPATLTLPPTVGGSALTGGKVEIGLNYPAAVAVNTGPLTKRVEIATLLAEEVPL